MSTVTETADAKRPGAHVMLCAPGCRTEIVTGALVWFHEHARQPIDEIHVMVGETEAESFRRALLGPIRGGGEFHRACRRLRLLDRVPYLSDRTIHVVPDVVVAGNTTAWLKVTSSTLWRLLRRLRDAGTKELSVVVSPEAELVGILLTTLLPLTCWADVRLYVTSVNDSLSSPRARTTCPIEMPLVLWPDPSPIADDDLLGLVRRQRAELSRLRSPDLLEIHTLACELAIGEERIRMPRSQFYWYAFCASIAGQRFAPVDLAALLTRDAHGRVSFTPPGPMNASWLPALVRLHRLLYPRSSDTLAPSLWRACGPHALLPSIISKINARLAASLGRGAQPYQIETGRHGGYGLTLPLDRIRWRDH